MDDPGFQAKLMVIGELWNIIIAYDRTQTKADIHFEVKRFQVVTGFCFGGEYLGDEEG